MALHLGVAALLAHDWIREALLNPIEPLEMPPIELDVALQPEPRIPDDIRREDWLNPEAEKLPPSQLEMKWSLGTMPVELTPSDAPKPVLKPIQLSFSDEVGAALRSGRPVRLPRQRATPSAIYEIALVDLRALQATPEALGEAPDIAPTPTEPVTAPATATSDVAAASPGRGEQLSRESREPEPDGSPDSEVAENSQTTSPLETVAVTPPPVEPEPEPEPQEPEATPETRPETAADTPLEVAIDETTPGDTAPESPEPPQEAAETPSADAAALEAVAQQADPPSSPKDELQASDPPAELAAAPEPERPEQVSITPAPAEEPETEAAPDRGPGEWTANSSEFFSKLTAHIYDVNRAVLAVEDASPRRLSLDVRFVMGRDGRVLEAEVLRSSGDAALDEAARAVLIAASPLPMLSDDMPQQQLQLIAPIEVYRR